MFLDSKFSAIPSSFSLVGLGGVGVTCSPRVPRFAGSNPADGFFQDVKILSTSPPGGTLSWGPESEISGSLKNLKPGKKGLVIPKFGGAQNILKKGRNALGSNDHLIKTIQYNK